jgi:Ca2+-binding EF-hand superfamily protein
VFGRVSAQELAAVLSQFSGVSEDVSDERARAMITEFDTSHSGDLSYGEFQSMMSQLSKENLME